MTLSEALDQLGIEQAPAGHEHIRKGWVNCDCPHCGRPGHFRLGINVRFLYASCWTCGSHRLIDSLTELSGRSWQEVRSLLAEISGFEVAWKKEHKPSGKLKVPPGIGAILTCHKQYLSQRGFDCQQMLDLWKVGGIGLATRLAWRIFIPIIYRGKVVSWTTRAISDEAKLRYISARPEEEAVSHKTLLLGHDYVRHACIVTEGPFDVFRIGPGAVGTFGTGWSRSQLLKLSKVPVRAIVFDNEPEAQRRARKLARELAAYPGRTEVLRIDASDPGSMSEREVKRLRRLYLD